MINKLDKQDRLEFLTKLNIINGKHYSEKIGSLIFGSVAIILIALDKFFASLLCFAIFVIFTIGDLKNFMIAKKDLFDEYFETKPRKKK